MLRLQFVNEDCTRPSAWLSNAAIISILYGRQFSHFDEDGMKGFERHPYGPVRMRWSSCYTQPTNVITWAYETEEEWITLRCRSQSLVDGNVMNLGGHDMPQLLHVSLLLVQISFGTEWVGVTCTLPPSPAEFSVDARSTVTKTRLLLGIQVLECDEIHLAILGNRSSAIHGQDFPGRFV